MYLKTVHIKNYRLLTDVAINLDMTTTVIVGRNNTGKTSLMDLIYKVTQGAKLSFHDYPIYCRDGFYKATAKYLNNEISFEDLVRSFSCPSIEFVVSYDLESSEQSLGALSPFIIDTDVDTTTSVILAEYRLSIIEDNFRDCFVMEQEDEKISDIPLEFIQKTIKKRFSDFLSLSIEAINPKDTLDRQIKSRNELCDLFPVYIIRAERGMDESETGSKNPLSPILSRLFKTDIDEMYPEIQGEVQNLRKLVGKTNEDIEDKTNELLAEFSKQITTNIEVAVPLLFFPGKLLLRDRYQ